MLTNRVGEENVNAQGYLMKIIEYNRADDIKIKFQDENGAIVNNCYANFKKGLIRNPFHKSLCGVGFIGNFNGFASHEKSYKYWESMINRCYAECSLKKAETYRDCVVCEEWLCFVNFHKWFLENYYEIDGETMNLDKDILVKNNRLYSPKTCVFVPHKINMAIVNKKASRGKLPVGVQYREKTRKHYCAYLAGRLGYFDTPIEAFYCYKKAKETELKNMADQYKDLIPKNLYDALLNYKIEVDD